MQARRVFLAQRNVRYLPSPPEALVQTGENLGDPDWQLHLLESRCEGVVTVVWQILLLVKTPEVPVVCSSFPRGLPTPF